MAVETFNFEIVFCAKITKLLDLDIFLKKIRECTFVGPDFIVNLMWLLLKTGLGCYGFCRR